MTETRVWVVACILWAAFPGYLFGESKAPTGFRIESLSIADGLSQSTVFCIEQDHQGYMWFGTEDGLNKYDGYTFRIYRSRDGDETSLSNNWISDILEDDRGTLWIVTEKGLDRLDRRTGRFQRSTIPTTASNYELWGLHQDRQNRLWLTSDIGIFEVDAESGSLTRIPLLADHAFRSLFWDETGVVWGATWGHGLLRFDPESKTVSYLVHSEDDPYAINSNEIRVIHEGYAGQHWVGTSQGLVLLDPVTLSVEPLRLGGGIVPGLDSAHITTIVRDTAGRFWIGTRSSGLFRVDVESGHVLHLTADPDSPAVLPTNTIWSIHEDATGLLWIGTGTGGGLAILSPQRFENFIHEPKNSGSLVNNTVWSVLEDRSGTLWIGTSGGLSYLQFGASSMKHLRDESESPLRLSGRRIWALAEDPTRGIWVGTYAEGLNHIDLEGMRSTVFRAGVGTPDSFHHALSSDRIRALLFDSAGRLWVGTDGGGLNRYDAETRTFSHHREQGIAGQHLSDDRVWALLQDREGMIWIGTDGGGLNRLDPRTDTIAHFRHSELDPTSIGSERVWSLHEDRNGRLWAGTKDGGLNRFDTDCGCFERFTANRHDLPNDTVYGILEDATGTLWLSTNNGLSAFRPQGANFTNFDVGDGLSSNEFNFGAYHLGRDGLMYFGGIGGLTRFDPGRQQPSEFEPPVVLTGFQRPGWADWQEVVSEEIIVLPQEDDFFSLTFAALDYRSPNTNRYQYQLQGADADWRPVSASDRRASYSFLPPGRYTFEVRGTNRDGRWSRKVARATIIVPTPFWATWWFRLSALALVLVAAVAVSQRRARQAAALALRLAEGREHERSEIAHGIHEGPIQSVIAARHRLEALAASRAPDDRVGAQLARIDQRLEKLIDVLRGVCWDLAKPKQLQEFGLATAVCDCLQDLEEQRQLPKVTLALEADEDGLSAQVLLTLYRVFQKAFHNVLQHADADRVEIRTHRSDAHFMLEVADDGCGFEVPVNWLSLAGGHYGLLSAVDAVEAIGGRLEVTSSFGDGTALRVFVPVRGLSFLSRLRKHGDMGTSHAVSNRG